MSYSIIKLPELLKMKLKNKVLTVVFILAFTSALSAEARKRAFTVFIGDYPESSGWTKIHAANDKSIVLKTLLNNGFQREDIVCLDESNATYLAITNKLDYFVKLCQPGDEIYIHFSCHGQWMTDIDGDESARNPRDRYDESIVPFDAQIAPNWLGSGYKGEHHITDDLLNSYFLDIEQRIGRKGCLMVIFDACHSGDAQRVFNDRDDVQQSYVFRGIKDVFELLATGLRTTTHHSKETDCIIISACNDYESNFECKIDGTMYGRLSYVISKVWKNGMAHDTLQRAIEKEYDSLKVFSPLPKDHTQTPVFVLPKNYSGRKLF